MGVLWGGVSLKTVFHTRRLFFGLDFTMKHKHVMVAHVSNAIGPIIFISFLIIGAQSKIFVEDDIDVESENENQSNSKGKEFSLKSEWIVVSIDIFTHRHTPRVVCRFNVTHVMHRILDISTAVFKKKSFERFRENLF